MFGLIVHRLVGKYFKLFTDIPMQGVIHVGKDQTDYFFFWVSPVMGVECARPTECAKRYNRPVIIR